MAKKVLPAGSAFDLKTGQWRVPDSRSLYERWQDNPYLQIMFSDMGNGTIGIVEAPNGPIKKSDIDPARLEFITYEQYHALNPILKRNPDALPGRDGFLGITSITRDDRRLDSGQRGLVLASGFERRPDGEIALKSGFDPAELRSVLFLWDKLDWPKHNVVGVAGTAETQFLESAGVMYRSEVNDSGSITRQRLIDLDVTAWSHRDSQQPGRWSIGRGQSSVSDAEGDSDGGMLVKLTNLISIPDVNVPLDEVLEFREKRRSELLALRFEIDAIYQRILAAEGKPAAWVSEEDRLVEAVEAQRRVSREAGWKKVLGSLAAHVKVEVGQASKFAAAAYAGTGSIHKAITAGAGALAIKATFTEVKKDRSKSPVDYIISIDRDFGKRAG